MSTYLDNSIRRKGTIVSLKPDLPHYCSSHDSVRDVANLMAKRGIHCILIRDSNTSPDVKGLVTTKDIALRVVGKGLDCNSTKVKDIMTRTPTILYMETPITEALSVMVEKNIRHLPLKNYDEEIQGVIDITKCFYQAMLRLERVSENAKKLTSLLKDVESDYKEQHTKEAERIIDDIENLQKLIQIPTLSKILKFGKHGPVIYISSTSSAYDAAKLMVKNSITALLVKDGTKGNEKVIGIFTSKDICHRVISRGYDSRTCTVAKVLTPKPEFSTSDANIASALKLMYKGNFLNLPVIDSEESHEIIGVVNVLQLIYEMLTELGRQEQSQFDKSSYDKKTLDEISLRSKTMTAMVPPIWDRFWSSLEKSSEDIQLFETTVIKSPGHSRSQTPRIPFRSTSTSQSNSRKSTLNQMIISNSNSRKSSFTTARRHSEGNFSDTGSQTSNINTLKGSNFKRILSQESLSRTRYYINKKTIMFKVRLQDSSRVHKISMVINEGVEETDDLQLLELLKIEIFSKLCLLPNFSPEKTCYQPAISQLDDDYQLFYYDSDHNHVPLASEFDLVKAIKISDFEELQNVEIMIAPHSLGKEHNKSFSGNLWGYLFGTMERLSNSINEFIYNPNSSFITVAFASLGLIMGFSIIVGMKKTI